MQRQSSAILSSLTPQARLPSWFEWGALGVRKLARDTRAVFDILAAWEERRYQRRALAALDEHALKDIGLNQVDVWRETRRPFWKD
ncbi:MAG: DUF1127 domain-containing protein [Rhodospirillales bacterium]|nr:DUF1127 domain-containing protein [Rhodospirillales bacterium]